MLLSLRFTALRAENAALHGGGDYTKEQHIVAFLSNQFIYRLYLDRKSGFLNQLSPFQELSIQRSLKTAATTFSTR